MRVVLSPKLIGLDEIQRTYLDRELSMPRSRVSVDREEWPAEWKATRTRNIPSASLRAVSQAKILDWISLRPR